MKQKIKNLFRKAYNKLFRKKTRGTHTEAPYIFGLEFNGCGEGTLQLNPEWLRKQFEEAYPDAAKFLNSIKALPDTEDAFILDGSFVANGIISARGLSTSYREWERKCLEDVRKRYPDLKVLVFHVEPDVSASQSK